MQPFPSLLIRADGVAAQGAFAEAQAAFLDPDPATVARLGELARATGAGIVAHFYMDAELQGVLYASDWPHIHVSDSLVMADRALAMVRGGARSVVVLGVDFMSENVRAVLDAAGYGHVPVYRVAEAAIGCSLAAAAEAPAYAAYLHRAARQPGSLHVVYINTSLRTKAHAHALVPTITCTSSNVVHTVLQAFAQVPEGHVWFGPDTYMGENLRALLRGALELDDAAIRALHPAHDRRSLAALQGRFHHFEQGACVVHHMFGAEVVRRVREDYPDVHVTAHLEVPGEMFALALAAQREGRGVVGSTSNILDYVAAAVARLGAAPPGAEPRRLRFILGTEAGMVTAIVHRLRALLAAQPHAVEAEIIFPVADAAVAATGDAHLPLVPGVAGGEGCSTAGGCATCPFMKMNSLDALLDLLGRVAAGRDDLAAFAPRTYPERVGERTIAELGELPIRFMREYQRTGALPAELLADIDRRHG